MSAARGVHASSRQETTMPEDSDPIGRAEARAAEWRDMQERTRAETRFDRCSPAELIKIAETCCDLQGRPLRDGVDIMALDDAWFPMFGEQPCLPVGTDDEPRQCQPRSIPLDQHPVLSVPDDAMLRPRDVLRLFGYARSTLSDTWRQARSRRHNVRHQDNGSSAGPLVSSKPGSCPKAWARTHATDRLVATHSRSSLPAKIRERPRRAGGKSWMEGRN